MIKIYNKTQYDNAKKAYKSLAALLAANPDFPRKPDDKTPEELLAELELDYQKLLDAQDGDEEVGANGYMYIYNSEAEAFLLKPINNKEELEDSDINDNKGE